MKLKWLQDATLATAATLAAASGTGTGQPPTTAPAPAGTAQTSGFTPDRVSRILAGKESLFSVDPTNAGRQTPKEQKSVEDFEEDIKKMLLDNVIAQMQVKVSQTAVDTFLMQEKWKIEKNLTYLQYGSTIAQMTFQYMVDMRQGWDKVWQNARQQYRQTTLESLK